MDVHSVIKQPLITEKATLMRDGANKYAFKVDIDAGKTDIKRAVETLFKVGVLSVRTLVQRGKYRRHGRTVGRKSTWKKAIVQLKEGDKIDLFEGV